MTESLQTIKKLVEQCSSDERKALRVHLASLAPHPLETDWGIDAETILSAIRRSSDLTKRGVRGIIAEAVFETHVLPRVQSSGWLSIPIATDRSYDALIGKQGRSVRIQIKLQRLEKALPKLYYPRHYKENPSYVVEVQKTRSGEKKATEALQGADTEIETTSAVTIKTRPYRFSDFDILAVNMHPSSGDWKSFRYTLSEWLLPRQKDASLIEIFQPVAFEPNEVWTDDLATCLTWFEGGKKQRVLDELHHLRKPRFRRDK